MSPRFTIALDSLIKRYGEREVLNLPSLSFESGSSCALVGPNGSGKSTLIKILAGLQDATQGSVKVDGDMQLSALRIGYMPQKSYVFDFSVFKNVSMAIDSKALSKDEVARRVEEALDAVGMREMASMRGSALSGGEAQRVALARMLVRDLDLLLLDEPSASMDVAGAMRGEEALLEFRRRNDILMITATHTPAQARRISDRIVMLSQGCVVEDGPTAEVLANPQSPEGREFLSYWAV